jgi:hypothetical protein
MVTGEKLSSGSSKTGSVPDGFRAGLLSLRPQSPLSHNELVRFKVETPARHRRGISVIHRRRARLEDKRPQLREVLTPIVKIGKSIFAKDGLGDLKASPGTKLGEDWSGIWHSPRRRHCNPP